MAEEITGDVVLQKFIEDKKFGFDSIITFATRFDAQTGETRTHFAATGNHMANIALVETWLESAKEIASHEFLWNEEIVESIEVDDEEDDH